MNFAIDNRLTRVAKALARPIRRAGRQALDRTGTVYLRLYHQLFPKAAKYQHAYNFFANKQKVEGTLGHGHYEFFYTEFFGLGLDTYRDKCVLDIGCGPRGSLEWAANLARKCVGVDPIVDRYRKLGIDKHKMEYVQAEAESVPFPDAHFDIVCAFNALDHVDHSDKAIAEIKRLCKPGGWFLLIVEVNHKPTITEPTTFEWNISDLFADAFELTTERRFEIGDHNIYGQLRQNRLLDETNEADRPGIVAAAFIRR